jgi:hypothetical protein
VDLKNIKADPPGKSEVSQGENREPGGSSFFWIKNSKLLATKETYGAILKIVYMVWI